jgi:hypothetical protein
MSEGKPVARGDVVFDPANINRRDETARKAEIKNDGTYEVKTLIGANQVTVLIPGRQTKAGSPYVRRICEVKAGSNHFDIEIP